MSDAAMHTIESSNPQNDGLKWLIELEMTSNPNFQNAMILNIFRLSKRIKDTEIITDSQNKRMLIWLKLDWWGRKFNQQNIQENMLEMFEQVLPSYKFRIIYDRALFDKALNNVRR